MAKKSTGRPVGRPVGTRTAVVELETLSFKVPKEFVEQVKRYAKQRARPVSELVRDGLEWRIGEGDPLNIRYETVTSGETGYEGNTGNTNRPGGSVEAPSRHAIRVGGGSQTVTRIYADHRATLG